MQDGSFFLLFSFSTTLFGAKIWWRCAGHRRNLNEFRNHSFLLFVLILFQEKFSFIFSFCFYGVIYLVIFHTSLVILLFPFMLFSLRYNLLFSFVSRVGIYRNLSLLHWNIFSSVTISTALVTSFSSSVSFPNSTFLMEVSYSLASSFSSNSSAMENSVLCIETSVSSVATSTALVTSFSSSASSQRSTTLMQVSFLQQHFLF